MVPFREWLQRRRRLIQPGLTLVPLVLLLLGASPGWAHHAPLTAELPAPWSGLASGLAHPFTDPRHLLFLLVLGLVGLMVGCALLELPSLHSLLLITFLTLALVLLDWLPAWTLSPSLVLHGTALGHLQGVGSCPPCWDTCSAFPSRPCWCCSWPWVAGTGCCCGAGPGRSRCWRRPSPWLGCLCCWSRHPGHRARFRGC